MATAPVPPHSGPTKLSFARVAASGTKENMTPRVAVPALAHRQVSSPSAATAPKNATTASIKPVSPTATVKTPVQAPISENKALKQESTESAHTKIVQDLKGLSLSSSTTSNPSTPSLVVNGSSSSAGDSQSKGENGTAVLDDISQRADSNSETGTKAPSLDGKSITSGTTFALDEKESLRPDDSASVKAAAEDDEAFSVRGSQMANSRFGSEVARVHRLRIGDMPERRIIQLLPESQDQGIVTPPSGSSGPPPPADNPQVLTNVAGTPDAFSTMYAQNPDEKLLEAMASPKDRIFLLRLEQEVISFVQSFKEPYMDLPPSNSFCRMLTHKLADYYHMTHSFEAVQGAVRIYRTPFCRVPPSLASIVGTSVAESNTNTTPPVHLPKKIMRRGEDDGQASNSPSKATSEVGSDGKEKTKEKLTREQREEAYNKARERIFGNSEKTGESTPGRDTDLTPTTSDLREADNEDGNGVSRASSVSGKERSNLGKRGKTGKQRRDDSESFDSRSQYTAYYGTHHYSASQQASWAPQYVSAGNSQYNGQVQQPYQNAIPQPYPQSAPGYPQMMPQGPINVFPQYNPMPSYSPQPSQPVQQPIQQRYPSAGAPMPGYGSPMQTAPPQQQQWSQSPYSQSPPAYNQTPSPVPPPLQQPARATQSQSQQPGIPYAFGQLPTHVNPNDPKSQHPIPGSYNRHAFNPKTQSFVPGNGMSPVQPPMPTFNMAGPQVGSPHPSYNTYNAPVPPQPFAGMPLSYGMSRQSSNNSLPAYHPQGTPPQHLPQHPGAHLPQMPQMGNQMPHPMNHLMNHPMQMQNMQNKGGMQGLPPMTTGHPHPQFTSLPNYGNPATLPQKPPTGN
ncbi:hypothetical protein BJ170DRAFT_679192 [Xylariales sp. AK1849]|nr:hypothetical protein BJ170DRAFT_679192 [Xylariales sp. AK1849]